MKRAKNISYLLIGIIFSLIVITILHVNLYFRCPIGQIGGYSSYFECLEYEGLPINLGHISPSLDWILNDVTILLFFLGISIIILFLKKLKISKWLKIGLFMSFIYIFVCLLLLLYDNNFGFFTALVLSPYSVVLLVLAFLIGSFVGWVLESIEKSQPN